MAVGHVILAMLVAVTTAAPAAEPAASKEATLVNKETSSLRDKRASEEIMFSQPAKAQEVGAVKKSFGPPFLPDLPMALPDLYKPLGKNVEEVEEEVIKDKDGKIIAKEQKVVVAPPPDPQAGAGPQVVEEIREEVFKPLEGGAVQEKEDIKLVKVEGPPAAAATDGDNAPGLPEVNEAQSSGSTVAEADLSPPVVPSLPETSEKADAEEILHGKGHILKENDDIETFLKELNQEQEEVPAGSGDAGRGEEEEKEGEGVAEKDLQESTNPSAPGAAGDEKGDYSSLLKYILMNNEYGLYGRQPALKYSYPYPGYYGLERRRRSLAPHHSQRRYMHHVLRAGAHGRALHQPALAPVGVAGLPQGGKALRALATEKELSRAKRTKRDLFDDDLYYNAKVPASRAPAAYPVGHAPPPELVPALYQPDPQLVEALAEQEQEEENREEVERLIASLVELYPSLFATHPQADLGLANLPGYMWYGAGYPEQSAYYPRWRQEEEQGEAGEEVEPEYLEMAPQVWNSRPVLEPPAWQPAVYPEQVLQEEEEGEDEEPGLYPSLDKRQMLSFVPGQRRKRYFFPFAREPYTHWGAFVPGQEKRENYDQAYRRLRTLALALANSRPQPSPYEAFSEYRKK